MPMYTLSTLEPLAQPARERIAEMITEIHCVLTGAPEVFVNVVFAHGVPLRARTDVHCLANLRKGRTQEINEQLGAQVQLRICELLQLSPDGFEFVVLEIPARWVMEGGEILPEPGEEAKSKWRWEVPGTVQRSNSRPAGHPGQCESVATKP